MSKLDRMNELITILNEASMEYYANDNEIMSNYEYDSLYDELEKLESELEVTLAGSPTQRIGYEAIDLLPKEPHATKMLSLDKTKDREVLKEWLGYNEGLLSYKLDGLTVVLTYNNGILTKAVTRGNGEIGEVITNNAKVVKNLPVNIPYKGELVIRGEAVISYSNFEAINSGIEEVAEKYKNPRNLCSGTVRQLNNAYVAERNVEIFAFTLVSYSGNEKISRREEQMQLLLKLGFAVVPYKRVNSSNILDAIYEYSEDVRDYDIPSDGLVLCLDDIEYAISLGKTSKFPKDAIAFKWQDEVKETRLLDILWSPSRTGLINPVAIFEPVELEGTTVSRASVHNVSVVRELKLGIGDTINVYKANMIIPQILDNITKSDNLIIPKVCPACGMEATLNNTDGATTLVCKNPNCCAKKIKSFTLFVSRNALNIEGLSEATIEKFIERGFIKKYIDIYKIARYRDEIIAMEGYGEKSYINLIDSIDKSKKTSLARVIYGLGIANVGVTMAKLLAKMVEYSAEKFANSEYDFLNGIEGIGEVIASSIVNYFKDEDNRCDYFALIDELELENIAINSSEEIFKGLTFVITGSLSNYENRDALKDEIVNLGGKVSGSVSKNTNYLINNEKTSSSSKNKKAKELGIEIISEEDYIKLLGGYYAD